jgi:ribosomal protein S18 acetylase RimI-like enzyme
MKPAVLLTIGPAEATDREAVVALWRACGLVVSYNDPDADFRFAQGKESSDILVGKDEAGRIVGAIMVGHDGHRGWLYYVAADPAAHRQGVGRQMVEAAEEWLRARSVVKVQLMVRETNTKVISFYDRLGYEETPRVIMAKWLKQP